MGNTKLFADRMFVALNGFEVLHAKSGSVKRTQNLQRVSTMTRNLRDAGYRRGNLAIQITLELDIEQKSAQIDPALGSDDTDISIVAECGGERYICKGVKEADMELSGSVGEGTKRFTFEALDITNENGTSVNVDISL